MAQIQYDTFLHFMSKTNLSQAHNVFLRGLYLSYVTHTKLFFECIKKTVFDFTEKLKVKKI